MYVATVKLIRSHLWRKQTLEVNLGSVEVTDSIKTRRVKMVNGTGGHRSHDFQTY